MAERVGTEKIKRVKGWIYFLGEDGYKYKVQESKDSRLETALLEKDTQGRMTNEDRRLLLKLIEKEHARSKKEGVRLGSERVTREVGFLYFIDKEGYAARVKQLR